MREHTGGADHTPLWSALLIALGFAPHQLRKTAPRKGDRTQFEADRGRLADTPSEIPAQGWKDILLGV